MRIGIDIDGVLANFYSAYEALIVEVAGYDLFCENRYPSAVPPVWDWPQFYGYSDTVIREAWRRIKASDSFWLGLGVLPDIDTARAVYRLAHDVYFVTDRAGVNAKRQTEAWLHHQGFPGATVLISSHKGLCAKALKLDVYVDDKGENIQDVDRDAPDTEGYLLHRPYNAAHDVKRRAPDMAAVFA